MMKEKYETLPLTTLKELAKANVREWFYNDVNELQTQLEAMGYELPFVREVTIER